LLIVDGKKLFLHQLEVSERAYDAWPPMLKDLFTPARTVETGKPSYKLEHIDGRRA
jgi:hypothetical protein